MVLLEGNLLKGIINTSINNKRILYSTSFMARSSEEVRIDLSTKNNLVSSITFIHQKKGGDSASLSLEKNTSVSHDLLLCLYDFDKTGSVSWTTTPLVIEEINESKRRTRLMLDLVVTKLSGSKGNDLYWQYMVTIYEVYDTPHVHAELFSVPAGDRK